MEKKRQRHCTIFLFFLKNSRSVQRFTGGNQAVLEITGNKERKNAAFDQGFFCEQYPSFSGRRL